MIIKNVFYLPSGRIFLCETDDGYTVECTEMRDVAVDGKLHEAVRNSNDPHVVWKHLVDYGEKWLLTVSTQKGCNYNCRFCDVANLPYRGNLTTSEILSQVDILLDNTPYVRKSDKVKIGFARMGEPACNLSNVFDAMAHLKIASREKGICLNWLPCFNSILPVFNFKETVARVIDMKENCFDGFLHFQISCNSTDENKRKELFGGADVAPIKEIINEVNKYRITNRTVTLNFIVMKDVPVDVNELIDLGLNDKFMVKLIPLNRTENSTNNNLETFANYENYDELLSLKENFENNGIPVVVDAIAKCEEAGLCCGQLAQIYQ